MARTNYDNQTKAAVMAALLAGQSITAVASEYKIPTSTVATWANAARAGTNIREQKKEELGELITDYLREILITMKEQAVQFRDKEWLKKQQAESAAVLHGVLTDKAIRILSAIEPHEPELPTNE